MGSDNSEDSPTGAPQEAINDFWDNLITKKPAKVTKIFPPSLYANLLPPQRKLGTVTGRNAAESYKAAAAECRARVKRVVKECIRTNEKFTDPDFDIENLSDKNPLEGLMYWYKEQTTSTPAVSASQLGRALSTLVQSGVFMGDGAAFDFGTTAKLLNYKSSRNSTDSPRSVHRIDWIFEKPEFVIDGFSSSDLKQGSSGDCWFIAAVATICSNPALMNKVCVARDEECGVYGFVFYRDGEWIWTVIDDNLYLGQSDFDAEWGDRYDPTNAKETKYKKNYQTGSEALYFASCDDENETWLPLLEKAYAKVHGDYDAIAGGWSGEAVEDLTGGVTTKVMTNRVLSKEKLWKELLQVGQKFLFSASSPSSSAYGDDADARRGLALSHAYSVLRAIEEEDKEGNKFRLVQIRNPWGRRENARVGEWTGPWSDGSSEWTPYWLEKLDYKFRDDGLFWMSYDEMLKRFDLLDRTRIFDEQWTVVQRWTSVSVAWVTGYLNVKFSVEIKRAGPIVFVLCQLDERYFKGLEGKYEFDLHFILQEKDAAAGDHLVRARGPWFGNRSISAEVDLEAGVYEVLPKIVATRDPDVPDVQEVVSKLAERNPQKLRQIGINYDIANAKGVFEQTEEERKKKEQKRKEAEEKKAKEKEAEEQAKADFEAWKKEEKAEYEVWKRKKERREKERGAKSKEYLKDNETQTEQSETTAISTDDTTNEEAASSSPSPSSPSPSPSLSTLEEDKPQNNTADLAIRTADPEANTSTTANGTNTDNNNNNNKNDNSDNTSQETITTPSLHSLTNPDSTTHTPTTSETSDSPRPSPPPPPPHLYRSNIPSPVPPPPVGPQLTISAAAAAKEEPKPWNAVCVIGLRVYSFDPEASIQFVRPKNVEEAAVVAVDGDGAAGVGS